MKSFAVGRGASPARPAMSLALTATLALGTFCSGAAHAAIAYDTLSGHTSGTLRGFGSGTIFAEDVTLEPGSGLTLVGWGMQNYGNQNYFGTMTLMFARRAPGDLAPDPSRVFASVDLLVSSVGTVTTWLGDLPFVEAPHPRLWVMWTFGPNTLGNTSLPSIGSDGNAPTSGSTDTNIYVLPGSSSSWQTIEGERWVLRLETVPAPGSIAVLSIVPLLARRRRCSN